MLSRLLSGCYEHCRRLLQARIDSAVFHGTMVAMKKLLSIAALVFLTGCCQSVQKRDKSETVYDPDPDQAMLDSNGIPTSLDYGAKYIPEAGTWIDYSNNPLSYHYHGRSREITPEEREIFDALVLSEVDPDNQELSDKVKRLEKEYAPILRQLAVRDAAVYREEVRQLIAEKNGTNKIETAAKDTDGK